MSPGVLGGGPPGGGPPAGGPLATGPLVIGPLVIGPLVIGLGNIDRGDDAVGSSVARIVAAAQVPRLRVVEHEDPTLLPDLWAGHDPVVVVDAVVSGSAPGTLHLVETGAGRPPLPGWARSGAGGTHAFGLASAVELARALHRLPARLVVVGVEAATFEHGQPLSAPVAEALGAAAAAVLDVVAPTVTARAVAP